MPSVCFYFQVHQPHRIKELRFFDAPIKEVDEFFDDEKNGVILRKVAEKCYLPTNRLILDLIKRYQGAFKVAYSITGVAIEQMQKFAPEVLESFQELVATGCVELIGETYYHSLAALYDETEFETQVRMHQTLMKDLFDQVPTVFRNTELIYDDRIGQMVANLGYHGVIAEGVDDILKWRSPNFVYQVPNTMTKLLLKNYKLSDDIAFRFSNQSWDSYPLTADKFAGWVHRISGNGDTLNLFMDYETFGEHQWESTGIFQFLEHVPAAILKHKDWNFKTPSEVIRDYPVVSEMPFTRLTSWADADRDISAWKGNNIQDLSLNKIYELKESLLKMNDEDVMSSWRKLLTSDHFYYMCTKFFSDGDVHAYFSPFKSPYDAFIAYMNVLKSFETYVERHDLGAGKELPTDFSKHSETKAVQPV